MLRRLKRLYDLPPREVVRKLRARVVDPDRAHIEALLASPKEMRPQRPYDFLSRYEAILARTVGWTPLDFEGATVLEIGCGPLLGWSPLAVFRGATTVYAVDPAYRRTALADARIRETYFRGQHHDLSALYGSRLGFDDFMAAIEARVIPSAEPAGDVAFARPLDIVLSNSCLEHIEPLPETLAHIARHMAPGARFLHLVDFGNHRGTSDPFADMYSMSRRAYRARFGDGINLHRAGDVLAMAHDAGLEATMVPYYSVPYGSREALHPDWSDYGDDDLSLKAGLLIGQKSTDVDSAV